MLTKTEYKIYLYIKDRNENDKLNPVNTDDIKNHFGWSYTHTYNKVKSLITKGFVERVNSRYYEAREIV